MLIPAPKEAAIPILICGFFPVIESGLSGSLKAVMPIW